MMVSNHISLVPKAFQDFSLSLNAFYRALIYGVNNLKEESIYKYAFYLQSDLHSRGLVQGGYDEAERSAPQGFDVIVEILKVGHIALVVLELKPRDSCRLQFLAHHLNQLYFFNWLSDHAPRPIGVLTGRNRGPSGLSSGILGTLVPDSRR